MSLKFTTEYDGKATCLADEQIDPTKCQDTWQSSGKDRYKEGVQFWEDQVASLQICNPFWTELLLNRMVVHMSKQDKCKLERL